MYKTAPKEVLEARPYAIDVAKYMVKIGLDNFKDRSGQMTGLIASLAFQNIITSIALSMKYPPGSQAGAAFIRALFHSAMADALQRWDEDDLKRHPGLKE